MLPRRLPRSIRESGGYEWPATSSTRSERSGSRFCFAVFRAAEGDTQEYVQWDPIAENLGFDNRLALKIVAYLREESLLEEPMMGNVVLPTHWGSRRSKRR